MFALHFAHKKAVNYGHRIVFAVHRFLIAQEGLSYAVKTPCERYLLPLCFYMSTILAWNMLFINITIK